MPLASGNAIVPAPRLLSLPPARCGSGAASSHRRVSTSGTSGTSPAGHRRSPSPRARDWALTQQKAPIAMTSTMLTLVETARTSVVAAAQPVDSGGILDTLKGLFEDGTDVVKIGINLLVLAIGGYMIAKAKMAAATVVMVVVIGAVIMWWANTGLGSTSEKVEKDLAGSVRLIGPDLSQARHATEVSPTTLPQIA